jgi:hypothetical protein
MAKRNETDEFWQARKAERVQRARQKKQAKAPPPCPVDPERIRVELQSPDAAVRARATRQVCPCRTDWETFQALLDPLHQLTKDASREVRAHALHVFEDAFGMESGGLPTTPRELTNEMVARRRATRWQPAAQERAALPPPSHRREPDRRPRQPARRRP